MGIGGFINLTGYVKRVVILTTVRHDHIDDQLVYGIDRTVLSEYQEIGCQRGDAVGGYPERNGHRSRREFVTTYQQPPDIPERAPETPSAEMYLRLDTFIIVTR